MCPGLGAVLVVCLSVFDQCIHVARAVKQPYTRCGVICGVFYVCERGISGSCYCCTACYYCFIRRPLVFVAGVYVRSFVCARVEGASGCGLLIPWPSGRGCWRDRGRFVLWDVVVVGVVFGWRGPCFVVLW